MPNPTKLMELRQQLKQTIEKASKEYWRLRAENSNGISQAVPMLADPEVLKQIDELRGQLQQQTTWLHQLDAALAVHETTPTLAVLMPAQETDQNKLYRLAPARKKLVTKETFIHVKPTGDVGRDECIVAPSDALIWKSYAAFQEQLSSVSESSDLTELESNLTLLHQKLSQEIETFEQGLKEKAEVSDIPSLMPGESAAITRHYMKYISFNPSLWASAQVMERCLDAKVYVAERLAAVQSLAAKAAPAWGDDTERSIETYLKEKASPSAGTSLQQRSMFAPIPAKPIIASQSHRVNFVLLAQDFGTIVQGYDFTGNQDALDSLGSFQNNATQESYEALLGTLESKESDIANSLIRSLKGLYEAHKVGVSSTPSI